MKNQHIGYWETIDNFTSPQLYRMAVPGGWLVSKDRTNGAITFYPDPGWDWQDGWKDSVKSTNSSVGKTYYEAVDAATETFRQKEAEEADATEERSRRF